PACSQSGQRLSEPRLPQGTLMFVVFDIGNVLVRWNPRNLFRKTIKDEARMERFLATALAMDFVSLTDIAADFSKAVAERARAFPEFARELHLFDERWVETIGGPIEENVALMRRLKAAGRPVYALSNFATVKFALARRMFDFLGEFDHAVISGHVGVVKPDPRIFQILFERSGRRPEELVFVDDQLKNIEAARSLGMPSIHYLDGVDLRRSSAGAAPCRDPAKPIASLISRVEAALFRGGKGRFPVRGRRDDRDPPARRDPRGRRGRLQPARRRRRRGDARPLESAARRP